MVPEAELYLCCHCHWLCFLPQNRMWTSRMWYVHTFFREINFTKNLLFLWSKVRHYSKWFFLILLNFPGYSFCYHCKAEWHPNQTCDAARAQRHHKTFRSSSVPFRFVNQNNFFTKICIRMKMKLTELTWPRYYSVRLSL